MNKQIKLLLIAIMLATSAGRVKAQEISGLSPLFPYDTRLAGGISGISPYFAFETRLAGGISGLSSIFGFDTRMAVGISGLSQWFAYDTRMAGGISGLSPLFMYDSRISGGVYGLSPYFAFESRLSMPVAGLSAMYPFDTKPPQVTLFFPNGGELYYNTQPVQVQWQAEDDNLLSHPVSISMINQADSMVYLLAENIANNSYAFLTLPDISTELARIRVVAEDEMGNIGMDESDGFLSIVGLPVVITLTPANVSCTSAEIGGLVNDDGGSLVTECGVYYGTDSNPQHTGTQIPISSGTGIFLTELTGLDDNTEYHFAAYAKNNAGTSFGEPISFTTPTCPLIYYDSLALVALYNATNGINWNNNTSWLSGPLSSWYGISTKNNRISSINLYYNNLIGFIPDEIVDLNELDSLILSRNFITGIIPEQIGNLENLIVLDIWGNQLNDPIPESLYDLTNLQHLNIRGNNFSGEISNSIGNLQNLKSLNIVDNNFSGVFPEAIMTLNQLTSLYLGSNAFTGEIPESIGSLTNLVYLALGPNHFSGTLPSSIGNLTNLELLSFWGNHITGSLPESISNLVNLNFLDASSNQLNQPIPEQIGSLVNLEKLFLFVNQIPGPIPESIGNMNSLIELRLYLNQISGPIPSSIGNCSNLVNLVLSNNQITGPLPESLGNLSNLIQLDVGDNLIDGSLPASIAQLTSLVQLTCDNNLISGSLPEFYQDLPNLLVIRAYNNHLSGNVPASLTNLSKLEGLFLADNNLSGSIPESICIDMPQLKRLTIQGNDLGMQACPSIQCLIDRGGWNTFTHSPQNDGFIFPDSCIFCVDVFADAWTDDYLICEGQYAMLYGWTEDAVSTLWETTGDGTFQDPYALQTEYYPGPFDIETGHVDFYFTAFAQEPCTGETAGTYIDIVKSPVAYAGPDATIEYGQSYTFDQAWAENYEEIFWFAETEGGYFNDNTLLHPTYYPSAWDSIQGCVEIGMIVTGIGPCWTTDHGMLLCYCSLPELITTPVSEITVSTAVSGGNVINDGGSDIIARGVVWSVYSDPDLNCNNGFTIDGEGIGAFISQISGLLPTTNYFIRAYATNMAGTAYGVQLEFSTTIYTNLQLTDLTLDFDTDTCFAASQTVFLGGNEGVFTASQGSSVVVVAGNNIMFQPVTNIESGAFFHAYITTDSTYCQQSRSLVAAENEDTSSENLFETVPDKEEFFRLYPNPTKGEVTLELKKPIDFANTWVEVYNASGQHIFCFQLTDERKYLINLSDKNPGVYLIRIVHKATSGILKIIKL